MRSTRKLLLWMDAGNIVTRDLQALFRVVRMAGMYSPQASGNLKDWTHPRTLSLLRVNDPQRIGNCNGAFVGVNPASPRAKKIVDQWLQYALNPDLICPTGVTRENHRFDQSILTWLMHNAKARGYSKLWRSSDCWGVLLHQDVE